MELTLMQLPTVKGPHGDFRPCSLLGRWECCWDRLDSAETVPSEGPGAVEESEAKVLLAGREVS